MKTIIRQKDDQNTWNFIFIIIFVLALVAALLYLSVLYQGFPNEINLFDAVLIALASFRLTRLVVYDKVTRFFREWFVQKREIIRDDKKFVELIPYTNGIRATIYDLLGCPWCVGLWCALITTFAYFAFYWSWFVIFLLAIAGVASFIQITANALGWHAEHMKSNALKDRD